MSACAPCATTSSVRRSRPTAAGSSVARATAPSSSSAAWSRRCAVQSTSRKASPSATRRCRPNGASRSARGSISATSSRRRTATFSATPSTSRHASKAFARPAEFCLPEDAWRQVRDRLPESFVDLGEQELKNIVRPMRVYALARGGSELPAQPAVADQPAGLIRTARAIPAAAIGVIESVARLKDACASPPDASHDPTKRLSRARQHPGLAKAVGILETVERIVDVVTDRTAGRDADAPEPPAPAAREASAGRENAPRRRNRQSRGPSEDADGS